MATQTLVKPVASKLDEVDFDKVKHYEALCKEVNVSPPELRILRLKHFLLQHDIPVFNLNEVIKYMDAMAYKQGKSWGWHPIDDNRISSGSFGHYQDTWASRLSDWCDGTVYSRLIPAHALQKVKLIRNGFSKSIPFYVSDYTAHVPDPFLMVVVNNPRMALKHGGEGRFVIDFWDEPGFGLESQLK